MKVVRHHHPGQGIGLLLCLGLTKLLDHQPSDTPIAEERFAQAGNGGEQVYLSGLRVAPGAQMVGM
ncbi:hypothetical protein D3C80_1975890 [compost metagenome]